MRSTREPDGPRGGRVTIEAADIGVIPAALVTGWSRGIGRDIGCKYARDGYDVANAVAYLRDARFVTVETRTVTGGELMR
ncbi:hypothetical protein ACFQE6_08865 [Natrinema soli]|uniref:Uncharacterized protein n=1 Tax=Natrinema soli TaxID=1930624 RepID=A0ABD5SJB6_9EURY